MTETRRAGPASATEQLLHPIDTARTALGRLPGAATVRGAFDTVLDTAGVVSPRSWRIAAYAGAGLLGAVGAVEWPVAAAGAAAVWLTQPRPGEAGQAAPGRPAPPRTARTGAGQAGADRPATPRTVREAAESHTAER
ncbi:hypothetical protein LN042_01380 [Kitasatospora sp. RB6PN24]|uniref:hypothetical protein n=1 Tax=Kitasatospora humi TaxID=2893891 RepID=UPI001E3CB36E|nr:hypothetical protein [Kitasatospora humi]MCC9305771.1 hypothetical protein [Kitasatospora humi]